MKIIPKIVSLFVVVLGLQLALAAVPARADAGHVASQYVQQLGNQALSVISNKGAPKGQKQAKLEKIFYDNIDFPWIGRFVMGRYWNEANDEQKTRYVAEYRKFLVLHYTSRFINYTSGTFKVIGEKDDGDGEYTVSMQLKSGEQGSEPVQVDYRVRIGKAADGSANFKIFDVIVEGVSLLTTQRSEFSSVISNKGIDYLIDQLAAKSSSGAI